VVNVLCALAPRSLALLASTKRRCTEPYRTFRRGHTEIELCGDACIDLKQGEGIEAKYYCKAG